MGLLTLIKVLVLIGVVLLGYLYYLGFFDSTQAKQSLLSGFSFVYFEVSGSYHNVGNAFKRLERDLRNENFTSEEITLTGVYFDDPASLQDSSRARCAVGAKLNTQEAANKAREFAKRAPLYRFIELPRVHFFLSLILLGQGVPRCTRIQKLFLSFPHRAVLQEDLESHEGTR